MQIWCDGGVGRICVTNDKGEAFIEKTEGTSNEQEYKAIILALGKAQENDIIFADSQLVVSQLTKGWKVHAVHLLPFYYQALELLKEKKCKVEWIPRDSNRAGWILE